MGISTRRRDLPMLRVPCSRPASGRSCSFLLRDRTAKEVASHIHVSVKTVETHRRNMMEKLNMRSIAELTKYAVREGLVSIEG